MLRGTVATGFRLGLIYHGTFVLVNQYARLVLQPNPQILMFE